MRALFQAGQDEQVIAAVNSAKGKANRLAPLLFVAAQSHERLRQSSQARAVYARLAGYPESSPWRAIGESNVLIAERKFPEAVAAANRGVTLAPNLAEAHFNLGRALGYTNDFMTSGAAFEKAALLDANQAYAYYYAGLAYQARRLDGEELRSISTPRAAERTACRCADRNPNSWPGRIVRCRAHSGTHCPHRRSRHRENSTRWGTESLV